MIKEDRLGLDVIYVQDPKSDLGSIARGPYVDHSRYTCNGALQRRSIRIVSRLSSA